MKVWIFLLFSLSLQAKSFVYEQASKYTSYPHIIEAIAIVESNNGKYLVNPKHTSFGICQIEIRTLDYLIEVEPQLQGYKHTSKACRIALLHNDDRFNIKIASILFERLQRRYGISTAIQKYNGGFINLTYLKKVKKEIK